MESRPGSVGAVDVLESNEERTACVQSPFVQAGIKRRAENAEAREAKKVEALISASERMASVFVAATNETIKTATHQLIAGLALLQGADSQAILTTLKLLTGDRSTPVAPPPSASTRANDDSLVNRVLSPGE